MEVQSGFESCKKKQWITSTQLPLPVTVQVMFL